MFKFLSTVKMQRDKLNDTSLKDKSKNVNFVSTRNTKYLPAF